MPESHPIFSPIDNNRLKKGLDIHSLFVVYSGMEYIMIIIGSFLNLLYLGAMVMVLPLSFLGLIWVILKVSTMLEKLINKRN